MRATFPPISSLFLSIFREQCAIFSSLLLLHPSLDEVPSAALCILEHFPRVLSLWGIKFHTYKKQQVKLLFSHFNIYAFIKATLAHQLT
jgi:hypothetical protein